MKDYPEPLALKRIKVYPLAERQSLSRLDTLLVDPEKQPPAAPAEVLKAVEGCASAIKRARDRNASVLLAYGAHLVKNGAMGIVNALIAGGWLTHLATNGAGSIHDWEFSFLGRSEESVRRNVATGTFGTWDETGRNIHLALLAGALNRQGYGVSVGRFIEEDGTVLPDPASLTRAIRDQPEHPLSPARAELLQAMLAFHIPAGRLEIKHAWKAASILGQAYRLRVPLTVHPGIGYDIISNHPMFNGAAIGRAAQLDFALFGRAVDQLDGGVMMSIGSAIMAPQVFEKSLSCVNNLRLQGGQATVQGHAIYVIDIQDGANWDWSQNEPPKSNPAYYLRFCKSFARMGGSMRYVQCDNTLFLHHLLHRLRQA